MISGALRRVGKESQFYPAILSARETADLALSVADTGGVRFLPAFTGLGAPWWEGEARGVFSGITGGTTKGHLVRAVLDSIAFRVRDVLEAAWGGGRARPETLRVDGGLTKNHYLMQRQADLLGLPVALGPSSEATATGAAALAAIGAGLFSEEQARAYAPTGEVFEPHSSEDARDRVLPVAELARAGTPVAVTRKNLPPPQRRTRSVQQGLSLRLAVLQPYCNRVSTGQYTVD